jgi:hypothetical protein
MPAAQQRLSSQKKACQLLNSHTILQTSCNIFLNVYPDSLSISTKFVQFPVL